MSKFTWGDIVKINDAYFESSFKGKMGSVCGISEVSNTKRASRLSCQVGDMAYIVEFSDGSDIEVAERYLEI